MYTAICIPPVGQFTLCGFSGSGGFKGGGGGGRPYWLIFLSKSRFFPCKRHTFRCAHLR